MISFLSEISKKIADKYKNFSDITIVFPSRRAGLFFRNYFSKNIKIPCWSPEILSLNDFMAKYSGFEIKDSLTLTFELYNIYKKFFPKESFEDFLFWGELIINDFDIIDKYLIDENKIFKTIKEWKEIEVIFPTEIPEEYKRFWLSINENKTDKKENFLKTWEALGKIYKDYSILLKSKKIAYEGLAFRELYNSLNSGKEINREKIIFAGFYAFSTSEEEIISYLISKNKTEIYFDIDSYYLNNDYQEAGYHLRKSISKFQSIINKNKLQQEDYIHLIDSKSLISKEKKVYIIGSPLQTGMAKTLGNLLLDLFAKNKTNNLNNTAIILPDESLLLQVLYSIPEEIKEFNVTMGFPFKDTQLFSLLQLIEKLHKNSIRIDGKILFHYEDIQKVLLHPYVRFADVSIVFKIINAINQKNIIYSSVLECEEFKSIFNDNQDKDFTEIIQKIFLDIKDRNVLDILDYLKNIILTISKRIENSSDEFYKKFQFEYIFYFYNEFEKLNQLIQKHKTELNFNTLFKIIINICKKMHIPFTGEPIKGLQVMGLLESRNLDFENVFILSLNEGILPSNGYENSFIPYSLRKSFKLPTYEDYSKIQAYFFYRLIQRANNIFLLYDTEISNYSKEKSRFILQLEKDIFKNHKGLNKKIFSFIIPPFKPLPINIEKTKEVQNLLSKIPHLSPTSLITCIDCKLKFYFEKVLQLEELETPKEELDGALIGSIFHKTMELIYRPYKGKTVDKEIINNILNNDFEGIFDLHFDAAINKIIEERNRTINLEISAKNKLIKNIIREFVRNTLVIDKELTPFKIYDLELKVEFLFEVRTEDDAKKTVILKGFIDRIDEINNQTRIIDYKTGEKKFLSLKKDEFDEFLNKIFGNSNYKDSFQIFLYSYVLSRLGVNKEFIAAIIYPKETGFKEGFATLKPENISEDEYILFQNNLDKLIQEIFDYNTPFTQTNDEKKCQYCSYKNICYR